MTKGYQFNLKKEEATYSLAWIKKGNEKFEIAVDPDLAVKFRENAISEIREVLKAEDVFMNLVKGIRPTNAELERNFGTTDKLKISEEILRKGHINVTAEYREKLREEKRKKIINMIHRNAIDPTKGMPHPPIRIENAMAEAKVKIDESKSAEEQVAAIIKRLQPILPIKFEVKEILIEVPQKFASKSHPIIKQYGAILREDWDTDGALVCTVEIPSGMQEEFFDKLNALTHGEAFTKIVKVK